MAHREQRAPSRACCRVRGQPGTPSASRPNSWSLARPRAQRRSVGFHRRSTPSRRRRSDLPERGSREPLARPSRRGRSARGPRGLRFWRPSASGGSDEPEHHRREEHEDGGLNALFRHDQRLGRARTNHNSLPRTTNAVMSPFCACFRNARPCDARKCSAAWRFSKVATTTDVCAAGSTLDGIYRSSHDRQGRFEHRRRSYARGAGWQRRGTASGRQARVISRRTPVDLEDWKVRIRARARPPRGRCRPPGLRPRPSARRG